MNEENRTYDEQFTPEEESKKGLSENCPAAPAEDDNTIPDILAKSQVSVQLPYRKIMDFTEIITGWQKEWNEGYAAEQESAEAWHFHSPAFLPGNRLALIFEWNEDVYPARGESSHVLNRYRVLVCDLDSLEIVQRFAFHGQDMELRTVLYTPDRKGIQAAVKVGHHDIRFLIGHKKVADGSRFQRSQGVFLTPKLIGLVNIFGGSAAVCFQKDKALRLHEVDHVVGIALHVFPVFAGSGALGELKMIGCKSL